MKAFSCTLAPKRMRLTCPLAISLSSTPLLLSAFVNRMERYARAALQCIRQKYDRKRFFDRHLSVAGKRLAWRDSISCRSLDIDSLETVGRRGLRRPDRGARCRMQAWLDGVRAFLLISRSLRSAERTIRPPLYNASKAARGLVAGSSSQERRWASEHSAGSG